MYEFSAPMPFDKNLINNLLDINNHIEKSRITSFYFSLPSTCELFTIFEQYRNDFTEHSDFNYWKDLIKYSLDKGMDFIYNLNNPKNLPIETPLFEKELDKLDILLNELHSIGVNKLRISNHKLLSYMARRYIEEEAINSIIHHVGSDNFFNQFKIKDIKNLLPDIKHFVKKGHLCTSMCGAECNYCNKCANNIEKIYKKQIEQEKKKTMQICIINSLQG